MPPTDQPDDTLLQDFIVSGHVEVPPSPLVPASTHAEIHSQILACGLQEAGTHRTPYGLGMLDGDAAGNNLLHAAPALQGPALMESPELVGVLTSLLGPGYRMHPHCRAHLRRRGAHTTMWHVDAYKGTAWSSGRHHEPHWVMVCYYPQDVALEMGPTELLPGSQYYRGDSNRQHYSRGHIPDFSEQMGEWACAPRPVVCRAGTAVVMHFDLWHRALESQTDANRLMLKFVAWRTAPPAHAACPLRPWPAPEHRRAFLSSGSDGPLGFLSTALPTDAALLAADEALLASGDSDAAADGGGDVPAAAAGGAKGAPPPLSAAAERRLAAHLRDTARGGELWRDAGLLAARAAAKAEVALFEAVMTAAKAWAREGELLLPRQLPLVIRWASPRCAAQVRAAADAERRARFVADREPIWRHVWLWLHGHGSGCAPLEAAELQALRSTLYEATEPGRMRAAYELAAAAEGRSVLREAMCARHASTSVRRTAMYGAVAAGAIDRATLVAIADECSGVDATAEEEAQVPVHATGSDGDGEGGSDGSGSDATGPRAGESGADEAAATAAELKTGGERGSDWLSAAAVRGHDGFDAELLLAAATPRAEVVYLALLAMGRGVGSGGAPALLAVLDRATPLVSPHEGWGGHDDKDDAEEALRRGASISGQLVALEALGTHAAEAVHAASAVSRLLGTLRDGRADGGARAVAARALSQLGTLALAPTADPALRTAMAAAVAPLAAAMRADVDRYVRAHAAEALACAAMLAARDDASVDEAARAAAHDAAAALAEVMPAQDVVEAVRRAAETDGRGEESAHLAIRWLFCRRRCPMTTPDSPF